MIILKYLLIGLLFLVPEKKEEWVKIQGDPYISFFFPNPGERLKKDVNKMRSWIFQTKNDTCVFGVVCTQLTKEKGVLDAYTINQLYLALKKESVSMPTAILREEKNIPGKQFDIREIYYTIMNDKQEMTYYKRFIFRDNCMYQITIGAPSNQLKALERQKKKFFDSVKFNEPEK